MTRPAAGAPATFRSYAIIPAAGRSRRMGTAKLLLPWDAGTVIERVLAAWRASCVSERIVVVRADDQELIDACRGTSALVVTPPQPPPEMKDSVRVGLAFVERQFAPAESDAWLLAPADLPRLSFRIADRLLAAHVPADPAILVPVHRGRRGHPVLFPWPLAAKVGELGANEGINALLKRHPVREIDCEEPAILDDLNTPADYGRLREL